MILLVSLKRSADIFLACGAMDRSTHRTNVVYLLVMIAFALYAKELVAEGRRRLITSLMEARSPLTATNEAETGVQSQHINLAVLSFDGHRLLIQKDGGEIALWDVARKKVLLKLQPLAQGRDIIGIAANQNWVWISRPNGVVLEVDLNKSNCRVVLRLKEQLGVCYWLSHEDHRAVALSTDSQLLNISTQTTQCTNWSRAGGWNIVPQRVAVLNSGTTVVVIDYHGSAYRSDHIGGNISLVWEPPVDARSFLFTKLCPTGEYIVSAIRGQLYWIDLATGGLRGQANGCSHLPRVIFVEGGNKVFVHGDNLLRQFSATGIELLVIPLEYSFCAASGDGKVIAAWNDDGIVDVFAIELGK